MGYRKEVVLQNLNRAFPEKTEKEIRTIARKFYRNFTDNFIEVIKLFSASEKFINRHFVGDTALLDEYYNKGQKLYALLGHNFNWELANLWIPLNTRYVFVGVYLRIKNKTFNRLFLKLRTRTGSKVISAGRMKEDILLYRNEQTLLGLIADQNPGGIEKSVWYNFFGKAAPFPRAPEASARRTNTPVVFCTIKKRKRGYYKVDFTLGADSPADLPHGELMKRYVTYLEETMREQPESWLWSHRRWKHDWKEGYSPVMNAEGN